MKHGSAADWLKDEAARIRRRAKERRARAELLRSSGHDVTSLLDLAERDEVLAEKFASGARALAAYG